MLIYHAVNLYVAIKDSHMLKIKGEVCMNV